MPKVNYSKRKIAALEVDARRYRWLRDQEPSSDVDVCFLGYNEDGPTDTWYSSWGDELDAEIDERMRGAEQQSEGK